MYSMIKCEKKRKKKENVFVGYILKLHYTFLNISYIILVSIIQSQTEEIENKVNKLTHVMQLAK